MKVVSSLNEDTKDGISTTLNLEKFSDNSQDQILFYGLNCINNQQLKEQYKDYERKVLLNLWNPCEFTVSNTIAGNAFQQVEYFDEVYQICPWTTEWMNKELNTNKFKFIWHPFSTDYILDSSNKIYDVCYHGGLHGSIHYNCIEKIKQFKYRFISQQFYPEVTNYNVSYKTKLNILAKCKINIVYNYIPLKDEHISCIKKYNNYKNNTAFMDIDNNYLCQLKARFHEAALCKTLNLVHRDDFNIIQNFYEPNKDFYYFESNEDLPYMINNILKTWEYHKPTVESAYKKCYNYNTESTYNFIKDNKCI